MSGSNQLWKRQLSVIAANQSGQGTELAAPNTPDGAALHITFTIKHTVLHTPSTCVVKIYNLSTKTARTLGQLGVTIDNAGSDPTSANGQLIIKAGYVGAIATLFSGSVRYVRSGRENPTDTYTEIWAAAWDYPLNSGTVNKTLSAGYTQAQLAAAAVGTCDVYGVTLGTPPYLAESGVVPVTPPEQSPRGRAMWGMTRDYMRDIAASHDNTWKIDESGNINFLARTATTDSSAILLNSQTGMIGMPEITSSGIKIRSLINATFRVGGRVKINNSSIQQPTPSLTATQGGVSSNMYPPVDADGVYKILCMDHTGDNRGNDWYTDLICLSVDPSAPAPKGALDVASGIPS